jgi:hypothetical protein
MLYAPQHEVVSLPFGNPTEKVELYYLHKAIGLDVTKAGPLYVLQAGRNGILEKLRRGDCGEEKRQWAEKLFDDYVENAQAFAGDLFGAVPAQSISAVVCVPTMRKVFMSPYRSAATALCSRAADLTDHIIPDPEWSSRAVLSVEQKAAQLNCQIPERIDPGLHILVVDDVIKSGASIAALIQKIKNHYAGRQMKFTVACALWLVATP